MFENIFMFYWPNILRKFRYFEQKVRTWLSLSSVPGHLKKEQLRALMYLDLRFVLLGVVLNLCVKTICVSKFTDNNKKLKILVFDYFGPIIETLNVLSFSQVVHKNMFDFLPNQTFQLRFTHLNHFFFRVLYI